MDWAAAASEIKTVVTDFGREHPQLSNDNRFTAWFLRAYITSDDDEALGAVTGGPGDKGVDAILIDHRAKAVFIVQAKYRLKGAGKPEKRNDVLGLVGVASRLIEDDQESFDNFLVGVDPLLSARLRESRKCARERGFRINLLFATLGRVSPKLAEEAHGLTRRVNGDAALEIMDGPRLIVRVADYLQGAAPPVPSVSLELESRPDVSVSGVLQRFDTVNELGSWIISVRGDEIAKLFELGGVRLFARNIRGFLGDNTPINKEMSKTLDEEPRHFFYYNNGITIVCDEANKSSRMGRELMKVSNPQIINGQQTTRMLSRKAWKSAKSSVLVKIIQVPRGLSGSDNRFEKLVSKIVHATNSQNAIRPSDLMANDKRQVDLETELRRYGYYYCRKRQTKAEIRSSMKARHYTILKKENLAQAVAGCDLDPVVARSGKEHLFGDEYYDKVFPNTDPLHYLPRYCLMLTVTKEARGKPLRGYAKWLVLGFVWGQLNTSVSFTDKKRRRFLQLWKADEASLIRPLSLVVGQAYRAAIKYYNANKGRGDQEQDISAFFRSKKGRDKEFHSFWKTLGASLRVANTKHWGKITTALASDT